jgi:hypothetical protein
LSPSASEGATIEGPLFLEHNKNNCFYQFYQYHNKEGSGIFFSRSEFFPSVDAVTTGIVLSHTSMELPESMEVSLITKTTFGSVFQRYFFSPRM